MFGVINKKMEIQASKQIEQYRKEKQEKRKQEELKKEERKQEERKQEEHQQPRHQPQQQIQGHVVNHNIHENLDQQLNQLNIHNDNGQDQLVVNMEQFEQQDQHQEIEENKVEEVKEEERKEQLRQDQEEEIKIQENVCENNYREFEQSLDNQIGQNFENFSGHNDNPFYIASDVLVNGNDNIQHDIDKMTQAQQALDRGQFGGILAYNKIIKISQKKYQG